MQVRCRKNGSAGNLDAREIPPPVVCRQGLPDPAAFATEGAEARTRNLVLQAARHCRANPNVVLIIFVALVSQQLHACRAIYRDRHLTYRPSVVYLV
jgi:hypothetical protein